MPAARFSGGQAGHPKLTEPLIHLDILRTFIQRMLMFYTIHNFYFIFFSLYAYPCLSIRSRDG
jgi:hypothetical protein